MPNLQHMDQVARRTEKDWLEKTKKPDPLPEGILPKPPVVQKPSVHTAQATVQDPRTPAEIAQRQFLKRKSPDLEEEDLDVLMMHWKTTNSPPAETIDTEMSINAAAIAVPRTIKCINGKRIQHCSSSSERVYVPPPIDPVFATPECPTLVCPAGLSSRDCINDILSGRRLFCCDERKPA